MNSGAPEWQAVPPPQGAPVVLLLLQITFECCLLFGLFVFGKWNIVLSDILLCYLFI